MLLEIVLNQTLTHEFINAKFANVNMNFVGIFT